MGPRRRPSQAAAWPGEGEQHAGGHHRRVGDAGDLRPEVVLLHPRERRVGADLWAIPTQGRWWVQREGREPPHSNSPSAFRLPTPGFQKGARPRTPTRGIWRMATQSLHVSFFRSTFTVARRLPTRGADDLERQGQRTVWQCTRRGRGRDRRVQQPREQLRDLPRGVDPGRADVRELHPRREVGAPRQAAVSAVLRPQCPVHARDMGRIWDPLLAFSSQTSGFTYPNPNLINPKTTSSFPSALHIQIMLQTESHQKKQNNFWNIPG